MLSDIYIFDCSIVLLVIFCFLSLFHSFTISVILYILNGVLQNLFIDKQNSLYFLHNWQIMKRNIVRNY